MESGLQITGVFFSLILSYFTFLSYKRQEFTYREFLGWMVLWLGFLFVTIFPAKLAVFAGSVGAVRVLDLFTIFGFMIVLSISYYTYVSLDRVRKSLEKAIRDLALSEIPKDK